jgi:uncharacterized protein with GYD domain
LTSRLRFASITPSNPTWDSKEDVMSLFLHQVAYSLEGWKALLANPQDRSEAVRPAIERLGGKIHNTWFAFGDYDVIAITEFPTNVEAAAIAIAFAAGGALRAVKTTPLLTSAEAIEALKKAAGSGYRAASASS